MNKPSLSIIIFLAMTITIAWLSCFSLGCNDPKGDAECQVRAYLDRWEPISDVDGDSKSVGSPWATTEETEVPTDPWGTPFQFSLLPDGLAEVRSWGPDRTQYTRDDISARRFENGAIVVDRLRVGARNGELVVREAPSTED